MIKYISLGIVAGIIIGYSLYYFFPGLYAQEANYHVEFRESLGFSNYAQPAVEAIYNHILPKLLGFIGGIVGIFVYRIKNPRQLP